MFKMSRSYQRPENALKRANEFIDVEKPGRALEVLYEVIKRGKMRTNYSEKLLEPIMFKYLELCVDLKKSHLAKEGLYQYRNIFQSVNVSSLETVVKFYLQMADDRTESARKESHQAVVDIDDLDNLATPEEILLSAVSGEGAQDRSDRTILTPWVKFLWESYRQCLELLRTNSRVEKLYHNIAQHAFKFCEKYNRKTEFRKLCDNLRTHLTHIQKQQGSATAVNLNNPETQQLNLETRLEQLNYAIKMELWQEAYKAIEDISDLMKKSKKMPKPHVMASYYEKLALVFWKAGNHLFHAAALLKLFQLLRDQKKNITPEEVSKRASIVLVATLAIPLPSAHPEFDRFIETEKSALDKIDRLANLLSLSKPPTRKSLIKDLVRLNVVNTVPAELHSMYQLMEVEFDPLHLCARMEAHLTRLTEMTESGLPQYAPSLQEMTITRLVKQVGQIYTSVTFKRLLDLSVFMTPFRLERILVDLVRHNDLQIRIDHRTNCVHFGLDLSESQREDLPEGPTLQTLPSETIRCQLVHMSSALQKCLALIAPDKKKKEMEPLRAQTIQHYQQTRHKDHVRILQRQNIIEERKEMLENQNLEREEQQRKAQEDQLKKQKDEEQERLRREASKREKERQEEQLKQIHTKQIKDKLEQISKTSYGQKMIERIDKEELLNLGADEIMQRQVEELEKERKELQKKLKLQERNVDYYERARRIVEIPKLKKSLEVQREKDRVLWDAQEKERVSTLIEEHAVAGAHSKRFVVMRADKNVFVEQLKSARSSEMVKKLNDFNARLEVERKNRFIERKEQRRRERREAYYEKKEEEEQTRRDEEMQKKREEEERMEEERSKQMEEEEKEKEMRRRGDRDMDGMRRRYDDEEPRSHMDRNGDIDEEDKSGPWRRNRSSTWRQKEQDKLDVWRAKDDDRDREREREREPLSERLASRDIRRDDPPPGGDKMRKDEDSWRGGGGPPKDDLAPRKDDRDDWRGGPPRGPPSRDLDKGPPPPPPPAAESESKRGEDGKGRKTDDAPREQSRDSDKGPSRDGGFDRPPMRDRDGDYDKGPRGGDSRDPDSEKGPPRDKSRDSDRGPPRDRDFGRRDNDSGGPPRDRDRDRGDFERGPPRDRDREIVRGPPRDFGPSRDFQRGGPPRSDFERGPSRDFERGPSRDFERGPSRDFERGPSRDFERGGGSSRDFQRGPPSRDFERGGPSRDFERGPPSRDIERGPRGGDRDRFRDFDDRRGGGGEGGGARADEGGSWRRSEPLPDPPPKKESFRRDDPPPKEERKSFNAWRGGGPTVEREKERDDAPRKRGGDDPPPRSGATEAKREPAWGKGKRTEPPEERQSAPPKETKRPPPPPPKGDAPPAAAAAAPDDDGWTKVRR